MLERAARADVGEIIGLIERAGVFGRVDVECVQEMLEDYFQQPDRGGYEFLVYRHEGESLGAAEPATAQKRGCLLGMACYGPTPLTEGTFDLYWLAVAPEARGKGIGRALMAGVETSIRRQGARLLVIETSGTSEYRPARRFYLAIGCQRQATIPDFYAPGDDLVIYTKRFDR